MPMLKKYTEVAHGQELKVTASSEALKFILDYSKSLEVKKSKNKKKSILIHLN